MATFENNTDDPSLLVRSCTVVNLLKDFRLLVLLSYILGYLVKVSVQIINSEGSSDDGRAFTDHIVDN